MKAAQPEVISATFPASVTQQRCWIMEQIQPGNKGLNLAVRWEIRGTLPGNIVEAAFQTIVNRHEILRTRFVERDGEAVQEVVEHVDFKLNRVDIRNIPEADQEDRIQSIARDHAAERFVLSEPCLLRVAMVEMARDRATLLISVHNSIFDGFSIGVLGHELGTIAAALMEGRPHGLPDLPLQYGDYAMWFRDLDAAGALAEEEAYWVNQLRDMAYFEFPSDHPRTPTKPDTRSIGRVLPADFDARMTATAKAMDVSVFALGAAATSAALERCSGRGDVSFAIQVAGRNEVDLEPLIGIFTNPIVLRFAIDPKAPLADHARDTREVVNAALAHQNLPFDRLVQKINPRRDPLRIPLVSIMFNLQRAFLKELSYGPFEMVSVQSHSPGTLYDLSIAILGRNSGWKLAIDYNALLFEPATVEHFADTLVALLDQMITAPERPVAAVAAMDRTALPPPAAPQQPVAAPEEEAGVEQRLAQIWAEALDLPPAQVRGNFFDLGGYSVLALRMLAKVGDTFGTRPTLFEFLADPTLGGLAQVIAAKAAPRAAAAPARPTWNLIELRAGAPDAPVLLSVNQTFLYQSIGTSLTSGATVANIAIPDLAALPAVAEAGFDATMEAAADLVLRRYGGRPLVLTGLCVDGRLALRLAQALNARGQKVASVVVIDTRPRAPAAKSLRSGAGWTGWPSAPGGWPISLGLRLRGRIGWRDLLGQYRLGQRVMRLFGKASERPDLDALIDATVDRFVDMTKSYTFQPYAGEVVIFVTQAQGIVPKDGVMGWGKLLAADTAVHRIRGWHGDSVMRSGFDRVSLVLDDKLKRLAPDDGTARG
ncbi:MAG: condensation domain-containing protein [Paracoccaceae bacterium]